MRTLKDFLDLLIGTSEACGYPLSDAAAKIMASDLQDQNFDELVKACARCRRELKHRLTLADILERLQAADGRYTPDEAWTKFPKNERCTRLITNEMEEAAEGLWEMMQSENPTDKASVAKTFKEKYASIVSDARDCHKKPVWRISIGEDAPRDAMSDGLLKGVLAFDYCLVAFHPAEVEAAIEIVKMKAKPDDHATQALLSSPKVLALAPPPKSKEEREASKKKAIEAKNSIMEMLNRHKMDKDDDAWVEDGSIDIRTKK